jgi:hypothetical protein
MTAHARAASGSALAVLALAAVVRGVGDMLHEHGSLLSWWSPIAWAQQTRAFVDLRWWPLLLSVVARTVLPAVTATRYVTPLREGGSLPGLMEADDLGTYVVKWRAAGQGVKVLVAEVVCGELARALGLPVPALVTVDVAPELAVGEPDVEVQELLQRSAGRNLGLDYLPGALDFEAGADGVDPELAGRVLWFDALVGNVDRSWRNPNMLFWHGRLQLIDHGAALTFHHNWPGARPRSSPGPTTRRSTR